MRLEWLEDILAVIETGSFVRAAESRHITQPAFSRRIKLIEEHLDVTLFDRSKRPVELKQSILDQQETIRKLATGLRDLGNELKRQDRESQNRIIFATQHSITTSYGPALIQKLSTKGEFSTRLRSANRDNCYAMLLTKQADFILIHQTKNDEKPAEEGFIEQTSLCKERFTPVYITEQLPRFYTQYSSGNISVIAYPSDVFLGRILDQEIFSTLWKTTTTHKIAETALTLAVHSLAMKGMGVGWLPYSLVSADIESGKLTDLSNILPSCSLSIVAMRLKETNSISHNIAWDIMENFAV